MKQFSFSSVNHSCFCLGPLGFSSLRTCTALSPPGGSSTQAGEDNAGQAMQGSNIPSESWLLSSRVVCLNKLRADVCFSPVPSYETRKSPQDSLMQMEKWVDWAPGANCFQRLEFSEVEREHQSHQNYGFKHCPEVTLSVHASSHQSSNSPACELFNCKPWFLMLPHLLCALSPLRNSWFPHLLIKPADKNSQPKHLPQGAIRLKKKIFFLEILLLCI